MAAAARVRGHRHGARLPYLRDWSGEGVREVQLGGWWVVRGRDHGHMDVVTLGDFTVGRGVLEPGWHWSTDVQPIAGTGSCQVHHTGICISGRMTVRSDTGEEITIGPGDVIDLDPGHDAWTDGGEPCVLIDTGVAAYAKPSHDRSVPVPHRAAH